MEDKSPRGFSIDFNLTTILKVVGVIGAIWLGFKFLVIIFPIILWLIAAVFFAVALNPAVSRIANWLPSRNRTVATGIAFLLVLGVVAAFLAITLPPIFFQITEFFSEKLPDIYREFIDEDNFIANLIRSYELDDDILTAIEQLGSQLSPSWGSLAGIFNRLFSFAINIFGVLVLTFMMLVEGPRIIKQIGRLASGPEQLERWQRVGQQMYDVIASYVNGQLLIAVIAGSVTLIVMSLLSRFGDVPNPLAMAGIVSLMTLIPLIGATIAAVIIVSATLLVSVKNAIILAIFFIVYQQIENATIQPHIQSRSLSLSTMMVFVVALIGARLGGILGAILAIPAAGCIRVLLVDYFHHSQRYQTYLASRQASRRRPKAADSGSSQKPAKASKKSN